MADNQKNPNDPKMEQIDSNLTAIIGITIKSFSEKYVSSKTVTFYEVEITSHITQKAWTVERRYNEFKVLHASLSKIYINLPTIPGTSFFKITSEEQLNKRKSELEKFLRACVQRKDIFLNAEFRQFLELEKNAPEVLANDVTNKYDYKKLPLGVRSFIVVPNREIMCVCCSDMNIISRADSMLTNFSFPWEKKSKSHVPLGAAFIYQCKPDPKEIYKIHKIWAKSFAIQTGVIYWEDKHEIYCVGNDDGKIHIFKAVPKTHYMQMDTLTELRIHTNRVMGLALDPETMNLYSCSTDKTFYVTNLNDSNFTNVLVCTSTSGYTNLVFDGPNHRIFLTNEEGELSIYSTIIYPPNQVRSLMTSGMSCIRAIFLDNFNNFLFTGSVNGQISIMNLGPPGKERLISEMSSFSIGKMKIRVCVGNPKSNELITGDQVGRVTVWSLKTGKPIYLWEAHPKSAITQMWLQTEFNLLWTGGKDMHINVWQLPEKWVSTEAENYENTEVKNLTAKMAETKFEKKYKKDGEIDSDDDDLNGWDFREY
jgi:WD40 repeat protein